MARFVLPFTFAITLLASAGGIDGVDAFAALPSKSAIAPTCLGMTKDSLGSSSVDRRTMVSLATGMALALSAPSPALALKQKNEALCGTGFFEHIYEYKCTAIGDIEDEGYSKALSKAETGLTDSLMGKLGVDSGDAFGDFETSSSNKKDTKPKAKSDKNASAAAGKDNDVQ